MERNHNERKERHDFLVFASPRIEQPEIDEVVRSLESGWLSTGPKVAQFEAEFADYKGASHAAALHSCTAALHLSVLACRLKPGDEVITSSLTFCATVNAILHAGAHPVLADVDPVTMNIDPIEIEKKITPRTRAIMPVHFAGRPCDMDAIMNLARKHDLQVIEDCAHAIETEYRGQKVGMIGDFGCFSFYVTKNIVTGEGGMVLCKNPELIARIKVLGLHGMSKDAWKRFSDEGFKHYQVIECGFKYNMMDLQAAIGLHQLKRVENYWQRRREIWNQYNEAFRDLPLTLPADPEPNTKHGYHLYTILIDEKKTGISRDPFLNAMTKRKIGVGVHYVALAEHPFYQNRLGWKPEQFPHGTRIGRQTVSIPLSAKLSDQDVSDVISAIRDILAGK